ncbi:unnamed protein product [Cuscuta campestris]|uniref:Uncharacterized protein n=1 Tax=Cuscuta campestris TaxID=132261 RepID=A0A484KQ90_9ASTE|nr:unnamed protein product [Cuscuta campestris]
MRLLTTSNEYLNALDFTFYQLPHFLYLNLSLVKLRIPALLKISSEYNAVNRLKGDIKQLNLKVSQLQALLEEKEVQLRQARSSSNIKEGSHKQTVSSPRLSDDCNPTTSNVGKRESSHYIDDQGATCSQKSCVSKSERRDLLTEDQDSGSEMQREEEFPEVRVDFQETFLGHTSPITQCRFSASGDNIASASVDGTVRFVF